MGATLPELAVCTIVPFVPVGNVDITARTVAAALGDALGQSVVENRPGTAGMVGAQAPMFAEAGLRDFEIDDFTGLVEPAGMPADAVAKVHSAAVRALATPQVKAPFASLGVQPAGNRPEQRGAVIRKDLAHWRKGDQERRRQAPMLERAHGNKKGAAAPIFNGLSADQSRSPLSMSRILSRLAKMLNRLM